MARLERIAGGVEAAVTTARYRNIPASLSRHGCVVGRRRHDGYDGAWDGRS